MADGSQIRLEKLRCGKKNAMSLVLSICLSATNRWSGLLHAVPGIRPTKVSQVQQEAAVEAVADGVGVLRSSRCEKLSRLDQKSSLLFITTLQ